MTRRHSSSNAESPNQGMLFSVELEPMGLGIRHAVVKDVYPEGAFLEGAPTEVSSNPEQEPAAADIQRRGHFLLQALDSLAEASKRSGYQRGVAGAYRPKIVASLKRPEEATSESVAQNKDFYMKSARQKFMSAYNLGSPEPVTEKNYHSNYEFIDEYSDFTQRFGTGANPDDTERRAANRDKLRKNLRAVIKNQKYTI
jgi:hypothetical protein